jgi:hypothetical protein
MVNQNKNKKKKSGCFNVSIVTVGYKGDRWTI